MLFTITYLISNKPNLNNRIYPKSTFKEGFKKYRNKIKRNSALGELEPTGNPFYYHGNDGFIHLGQVSHLVTKIVKKRKKFEVTCKTLKTPMGKVLEQLIGYNKKYPKKSMPIEMKVRGLGNVDKEGVVTNLQIISCDICKKEGK